MKYLYLLVLLLLLTLETSSQTLSDSSGLSVLQKKWRINTNNSFNSVLNEDSFRANKETNQTIQDQKDNLRQNAIRQQSGLPLEAPPVRKRATNIQNRNELSTLYQVA